MSLLRFAIAFTSLCASAAHAQPAIRPASDPTSHPAASPPTSRPATSASQPSAPEGDDAGSEGSDDFDFGDEDKDDAGTGASPSSALTAKLSPWALTGFLRSDWALWTERLGKNPFAKARQNVDLTLSYKAGWLRVVLSGHFEYDLAYRVDRAAYDQPTLDSYEWLFNTRDALVAGSFGSFEITLGRQIVAWGEGDAISPLDVVNPRDLREPGLADLDDIRQPILATRVGYFSGPHRVEAMVIHESDFGYRSPPMGPFSPFRQLIRDYPLAANLLQGKTIDYRHAQDRFSVEQQQFLLRWVYKGQGIDFGLHIASVLDQRGVVTFDLASLDLAAPELMLTLEHPRYTVGGYSGALPYESLVFKWEISAEFGRRFNVGQPPASLTTQKTDLINLMGAVSYTGVDDLVVAVELWKPWLINAPPELLFDANAPLFALRASYLMLQEKLRLSLAATISGFRAEYGWLVRAEALYQVRDGLKLTAGYITFQPGEEIGPFYGLNNHDRFFFRLRWDFQLI